MKDGGKWRRVVPSTEPKLNFLDQAYALASHRRLVRQTSLLEDSSRRARDPARTSHYHFCALRSTRCSGER